MVDQPVPLMAPQQACPAPGLAAVLGPGAAVKGNNNTLLFITEMLQIIGIWKKVK